MRVRRRIWRVPHDHARRWPGRRPAAPGSAMGQWFVFKPWVYDVDAAIRLLRAVPRPPQPLPVMDWARAYGLIRDPGSDPHAVSLIGPGPGFDPGYAMTTDLDDPVIIATLTTADGEPDGPLLTGECHRLYKAAVTGAGLPAFVLTAAETLSIRHPVILGPGPAVAAGKGTGDDHGHHLAQRRPRPRGPAHRDAGRLPARRPQVRVFTYQADGWLPVPAGDRRRRLRGVQRRPRDAAGAEREIAARYRDRQAALALLPRKLTVLQQVVLPSPSRRVAQIVV